MKKIVKFPGNHRPTVKRGERAALIVLPIVRIERAIRPQRRIKR